MSLNLLDHLALAYQPIWGRERQLLAVRLRVRALHLESVDAGHFMQLLHAEREPGSPPLLLSFVDRALVLQALEMSPMDGLWIELPDEGSQVASDMRERVALARRMGHRLVQCAPLARADAGPQAPTHLLRLWPEDVAQALRAAAEHRTPGALSPRIESPVLPGQLYEQVGSSSLATHCLDDRRALGICEWPIDDCLHQHRHQPIGCDLGVLRQVLKALESDLPLDEIEDRIYFDPVLTYRMLRMVNSVQVGSGREITTIRHALMMMGMGRVRDWLQEQMASAADEANLRPVRQSLVLRARLMDHLVDAGPEHDLRAEVHVTGLFSRVDGLLQEPLADALERLPLPGRVRDALIHHHGPYVAYLDVARHMEDPQAMGDLPVVCHAHSFRLDDVNRALIRTLCHERHLTAS